jgi:hypothetical protein
MRAIPGIVIDEMKLTSSTVSEPHASEHVHAPDKVYVSGDRVISVATHRTYESLSGTAAPVTMTIASPGVVTWVNHDLPAAAPVAFTTTGALPSGVVAGTIFYVTDPTANTFKLALTKGGAAIATTGAQSGAHTAVAYPNVNRALNDPQWWIDVGPTMKWAMHDLYQNTSTTDDDLISNVITPRSRADAIAITGLDADRIEIIVEAGSPLQEVYRYTEKLTTRDVASWYDFYFAPFKIQETVQRFDLPPFASAVITINVLRDGGQVSCAGVVLGRAVYAGKVEIGPVSDTLNFSEVRRDTFGKATLIPRPNVPTVDLKAWIKKDRVNAMRALRDQLNAVPAFWSGIDDPSDGYFEAVSMIGVYKRFAITLNDKHHAVLNIQLEGL